MLFTLTLFFHFADMSYKIVAFIRRRKNSAAMAISYIPASWESQGIMYWPRRDVEMLRRNANSLPEDDWMQYKAIVKKTNVATLEKAML